jgi:putative tryptophan/tyrosine transport system substrate-binding protein
LSETGYVVGRDVMIEQRLADGEYDRLPALAADLVNRRVNLIAALAPPAAFAAKAATTTIPIVFVGGLDPVKAGLVASLNRPGGNVTGITFIGASLGGKRLELARELVPNVGVVALLTHPHSPDALEESRELQSAAKAIGQQLLMVSARISGIEDSVTENWILRCWTGTFWFLSSTISMLKPSGMVMNA